MPAAPTFTKDDRATKGDAVCLTTYQALFNGKSKFFNREIAGIVFDDAHTAEHLLREHFSLRISKERLEEVYLAIAKEFADYFYTVGLTTSFDEIINGTGGRLLLAPPFEVRRGDAGILKALQDSPVASDETTTFAWAYLKDRIVEAHGDEERPLRRGQPVGFLVLAGGFVLDETRQPAVGTLGIDIVAVNHYSFHRAVFIWP